VLGFFKGCFWLCPQLTAKLLVPVFPLECWDGAGAEFWLKGVDIPFGLAVYHCKRSAFRNVESEVGALGKGIHSLKDWGELSFILTGHRYRLMSSGWFPPFVYPWFRVSTPHRMPSIVKLKRMVLRVGKDRLVRSAKPAQYWQGSRQRANITMQVKET